MQKVNLDLESEPGAPHFLVGSAGLQVSNISTLFYAVVDVELTPAGSGTSVRGRALIDTGADVTGVDERLPRNLGWSPIKKDIPMTTADGSRKSDLHEVTLAINGFQSIPLRILTVNLSDHRYIALVGTDVLARGRLTYDGLAKRFTLELP